MFAPLPHVKISHKWPMSKAASFAIHRSPPPGTNTWIRYCFKIVRIKLYQAIAPSHLDKEIGHLVYISSSKGTFNAV